MEVGKISDFKKQEESITFRGIKLKPMQVAVINCIKKYHVLVNLPTGFGKSMLFQYPASQLKDKTVLVFVPLKALLWDCLKQAQELDISAQELAPAFIKKFKKQRKLPQLLFLTPERMFKNPLSYQFVEMINNEKKIEFVVIDEAHCVSEWGSDFRPDYSKLCDIRQIFGNLRILGMSATMPSQSRQDLVKRLKIPNSYYFQSSSNRPNLIYQIKKCQPKEICKQIIDYLKNKGLEHQCGIIYCQTIKKATEIYQKLQRIRKDCCLFHSKISEKERAENFNNFMNGNIKTIVATICFGMGVNKKNIRYVVNVGVSLSAENYYQESGRAGRDGETSYCLLLTFKNDDNGLQFLIKKSTKKTTLYKRRIYKLHQIKQYSVSEGCRKQHLFRMLGEHFTIQQCKKSCDFCIEGIECEYNEMDLTDKGLKIAKQFDLLKPQITKKQLNKVIRGIEANIRYKGQIQKVSQIKGIISGQKQEIVNLLIEQLIKMKLLSIRIKFSKYGKVQYVEAGDRIIINETYKVVVRIPIQKKNKQDLNLIQDKKVRNKFDDYLKVKTIKTQKNLLQQKENLIKKGKSFEERINKIVIKQNSQILKNEGSKDSYEKQAKNQEMQEIKVIPASVQYHNFLEDLFGKEVDHQETVQHQKEYIKEMQIRDIETKEYEKEQIEEYLFEQNEEIRDSRQKYVITEEQQKQLIEEIKRKKIQKEKIEPILRKQKYKQKQIIGNRIEK